MKKNQLLTISLIGILCFVLGYWTKTLNSDKMSKSSTQVNSEVQNLSVDTTQESALQESKTNDQINYAKLLKGKYILRGADWRSEEHTSELQSHHDLVCRLLLEKN